jgi:hypothetical protein
MWKDRVIAKCNISTFMERLRIINIWARLTVSGPRLEPDTFEYGYR